MIMCFEVPKDYTPEKHSLFNGRKYRTAIEEMPNVKEISKAINEMAIAITKALEPKL